MVRAYEEQKNIKEAAKKIGISLAKSEGISSSNVTTSGIRLKNGTDCYFFFMQLDEENTAMGSCLRKNKTTNQYTLAIIAESTSKDTFLRAAKTLQGGLKSNKGLSPKMQQSYNNLVQLPKALESAEKFFTKTKNQSK